MIPSGDSHPFQIVRRLGMRTGITFDVAAGDRVLLEAIIAAPTPAQKHVWRAKIILMSGDGLGTFAIMEATGKSKPCVWRWQEPFMSEGVDGLLRDKSRPPGIAPLDGELVERVVALTLETPRQEATHWTVRAMAKAVGIAVNQLVDHSSLPALAYPIKEHCPIEERESSGKNWQPPRPHKTLQSRQPPRTRQV